VKPKKHARTKKRSEKAKFVGELMDLTMEHFSKLSPAEQEKRLRAAEHRLGISETYPKPPCNEETRPIRLEAQSPHESRS
jgi:hypothetical protein